MNKKFHQLLFLVYLCCFKVMVAAGTVPISSPVIIRTIPHDTKAFTQGLLYFKGYLYESTGLYNQSSLRCINVTDGKVVRMVQVPDVFAEGLCIMDSCLVQITWQEHVAIKYNLAKFAIVGSFSYTGEGWGLASDPKTYFMSNGSDSLYIRNKHFSITRSFQIRLNNSPLKNLNELEYVNKLIYANVWFNTNIYCIDPKNGNVIRIIDCSSLVEKNASQSNQDVLNGIAYNNDNGTFYITGKNWRYIFEVKF